MCSRRHPGFCRELDGDITGRYEAVLSNIKHVESPETAGTTALRFCAVSDSEARDTSKDIHVWFASLRQSPRYYAVYFDGLATDRGPGNPEFPFYISDAITAGGAITGADFYHGTELKSIRNFTSFSLALLVARTFSGPIIMDELVHTVTRVTKTIYVTGYKRLIDDVTVPREVEKLPPPRRHRCLDLLRKKKR